MDQKDSGRLKAKIDEIRRLYSDYLRRLGWLQKEQSRLISGFVKETEQKKLQAIRKDIIN